jgi:hypothetical protein
MNCPKCSTPLLADGTNPGTQPNPLALVLPRAPANDFADHVGTNEARDLELATARAEAALSALRVLLQAFESEMCRQLTSTQQQIAYRRALATLEEAGRG